MKFTIHTLRPCRDGEEPTHAAGFGSYRESSIAVEAPTRDAALVAAREKARAGETPKAWSPEPTRSHGGRLGHRELGAEAIRCGRHACLHTDGRWLAFGPTGWSSDADDDNVVDAEIPKQAMAMGDLLPRRHMPTPAEAYERAVSEERKRELAATCRTFVAEKQAEHAKHAAMLARDAAGAEYASWIIPRPDRSQAPAKPAWHALSPDLARSTHQVNPDHGSALLRPLREGKA